MFVKDLFLQIPDAQKPPLPNIKGILRYGHVNLNPSQMYPVLCPLGFLVADWSARCTDTLRPDEADAVVSSGFWLTTRVQGQLNSLHMAMGQNPNRLAQSNHYNMVLKWVVNSPTPKWLPLVLTHCHIHMGASSTSVRLRMAGFPLVFL